MSQLQNALQRMEKEIHTVLELAQASEYQVGYNAGYGHGYSAGSTVQPPVSYASPAVVLVRAASWLDANQLPLTAPHTAESLMRRRVTAFLRELAQHPEFCLSAVNSAIEDTAEGS